MACIPTAADATHASTCASAHPITKVSVSPNIVIPEYYIAAIPVVTKGIYDVLGVRYVHVVVGAVDYYIYEHALAKTVERLSLYC